MSDLKLVQRLAMRNRGFALVAVLTLALGVSSHAQTGFRVRPLSLKDCIQIALEHNLDVKIERFTPELARYDLDLSKACYEPVFGGSGIHHHGFQNAREDSTSLVDVTTNRDEFRTGIIGALPTGMSYELGGGISNTSTRGPFDAEDSVGSASITLRQPLLRNLWIDEARLNILVSRKLLDISELSLRQQIMNTVTSVELAYYDLRLAQQNVGVQEEALKLAQELLDANKHRVEQGVLAPLDEKQAESQVAARRAVLLVAQNLLAAQQNVMKGLLSDNMAEWRDVLIEPVDEMSAPRAVLDRQASWRKGLAQRPDFLQAKLDIERLGYVLRYTRNQLYPQLDLVGSYGFSGAQRGYSGALGDIRRGESPFYSYGAVVSIPLGNGTARNKYNISKAEQQQALVKLQQLEQSIMLQIEDAVKLAQTNFDRVGATREARQFADGALEAEQTKLENGRSTSFIVIQLQRDLTTARSAEVQALADYNKALAQLALREGTVFEKHKLNVKTR